MKKITAVLIVLFFCICNILVIQAEPNKLYKVTIKNNFPETLNFALDQGNFDLVPNLERCFFLGQSETKKTAVIKPVDKDKTQVYITVNGTSRIPGRHLNAYWSLSVEGISGYLGDGIAYSWQQGKNASITFCSPKEYAEKGGCF